MMFKLDRTNTSIVGTWWWTIDRIFFISLLIIMAIGLVLVSASSPSIASRMGAEPFFFVKRQVIFVLLAIALMFMFSLLSVQQIKRVALVGCGLAFLLLALVPVMGTEVKGAARWVKIFGFTVQPSEIMKPFFIIATGWVLSLRGAMPDIPAYRIAIAMYLLLAGLLVMQPDIGMTVLYSVIWGAQLFLAGLPLFWVFLAAVLGISGMVAAYFTFPHVQARIESFFNASSGDHYQNEKALEAFVNGGFIGQGPGQGIIKDILPDAHTDFIFAVAGEELGLLTCLIIVALYAFVVLRGFMKLFEQKDLFTIYVCSGLLMLFGLQALINMSVSMNLLPNTGMTLPLMSYGGSSMMAMAITTGVILALTRKRYGNIKRNYG